MNIGLVVIDEDPRLALEVARAADRAGVHSIWTIDYYNRSSLTRASAFAATTEQAVIGTCVTPLFARVPLALAAAASDIQFLAGGRFRLGVGPSTRRMNRDWYGVALEHPAPQVVERIDVLRQIAAHRTGPFNYSGRFDNLSMTHFDRAEHSEELPIFAAGVGDRMIEVVGQCADGFIGHPLATAAHLQTLTRARLERGRSKSARDSSSFVSTTVVVAVADTDADAARHAAAAQVGFYSTVKGYDALFPHDAFAAERVAAREAYARRDLPAVTEAGLPMVEERAVFGKPEDLSRQLERYEAAVDWALLYSPHYGLEPGEIYDNEMALVEVAAAWRS